MESPFIDPVEQEIWLTVRAMNDAWTKGDPDDLKQFFHHDMIAVTPVDRLRRENGAACIEGWSGFARNTRILHWNETDPLIRVYGNAAVVAYYFDMSFEMGDQTLYSSGRDLFFYGERR